MTLRFSLCFCSWITLLLGFASVSVAGPPRVEATNIRRVFHNGEHNAFTDLIKWKDRYWLTFRTCPDGHMVHPTASIMILSSADLKEWRQEHRFSVAKRDTRDPHFLKFKGSLFVYTGTWYCGDTSPAREDYTLNRHLGYAAWTGDGKSWKSPVMLEGTFGHYIWRAASYDGKAYLCGRRNREFDITAIGEGTSVESAMLESDDGLIWRTRTLFQEARGDETAFLFEPDGRILAIGRCFPDAQLLESSPPWTTWKRREFDRHIGGPLLVKWGEHYLVGGRKSDKDLVGDRGPKTALYWLNKDAEDAEGLLTEFVELPSGGDNSYPGFLELSPTRAVVSWYSSHEKNDAGEGITAIYMADLEIKEAQ